MNGDSPTANIAFIDFRQANECPDLADKPVVGNVASKKGNRFTVVLENPKEGEAKVIDMEERLVSRKGMFDLMLTNRGKQLCQDQRKIIEDEFSRCEHKFLLCLLTFCVLVNGSPLTRCRFYDTSPISRFYQFFKFA